jgi:hypothetical protein
MNQNLFKSDLLVRSCQDRNIEEDEEKHLKEYVESIEEFSEFEIDIEKNKGHKKRRAKLNIRFCDVSIKLREKRKKEPGDRPFKVYAILAKEYNPPKGEEKIYWLLLTTMEVNNFNDAYEKIDWYCKRWLIEIYFKTLKSCCKIEDRQLKEFERLKISLTIDLILAWRILFLTYIARVYPYLPAIILLQDYEWKALHLKITKKNQLPEKEPNLKTIYYQLAQLSGYLNRKNDPPPGIFAIYRGLNKLNEFASMFLTLTQNVGKG